MLVPILILMLIKIKSIFGGKNSQFERLMVFYEYFVASTLTSPASILKYFGRIFFEF